MEIELERTFLAKKLPSDLEQSKSIEIVDVYIPQSVEHPRLRIRKMGSVMEMTKKTPLIGIDSSEQSEETIPLNEGEYQELLKCSIRKFRKIRYYYDFEGRKAEVDIFQDDLKGLVLVDFEFKSSEEKNNFQIPDFCLVDVTQERFSAGGILAGKKYSDVEPYLKEYNYQKL